MYPYNKSICGKATHELGSIQQPKIDTPEKTMRNESVIESEALLSPTHLLPPLVFDEGDDLLGGEAAAGDDDVVAAGPERARAFGVLLG